MSDPHHTPDYEPPRRNPRHDYRGLIGLILAATIGLVLVIAVAGAAWSGRAISDAGREVLVALGGAIVGALAGFLGSKALNGH